MKLTIGIKSLNEEGKISSALTSAVAAAKPWGGEVILADSGSTDLTVEIAKTFAIKIFQLENSEDASCGAGAQLAFQQANGEYFYLLDGDMVLNVDFVKVAIDCLDRNSEVGAVGGIVRELNLKGQEVQIRVDEAKRHTHRGSGVVDRLDGGGLYRASAIRDVGYFSDRNLHAFEEFELAARLHAKGWKLMRVDMAAVDHFAHDIGGYELLRRRIKARYSDGSGEVLRSSIGTPQFFFVMQNLSHIRNSLVVIFWWVLLLLCAFTPLPISIRAGLFSVALLAPLAILSARRKTINLGIYSLVVWNVAAIGLLRGLFQKRISPVVPLRCVEVSSHLVDLP